MSRIFAFLVLAALIAPVGAKAQESAKRTPANKGAKKSSVQEATSGQGYGVAGCGLGSLVLGPQPGMIQIVSATLNATGMQSVGITIGTSNCDIPEMGHQASVFIEVNREALAKDAARGQGETVAGLAAIFNCSNSSDFGQGLREDYSRIFDAGKSSYDVTREILSTINNHQNLKASCQVMG